MKEILYKFVGGASCLYVLGVMLTFVVGSETAFDMVVRIVAAVGVYGVGDIISRISTIGVN